MRRARMVPDRPDCQDRRRWRAWFRREVAPTLLLLTLLMLARTSFANHYVVPSGSMEYTLMPGDRVLVDMSAYGLRVPFTDDVLVTRDLPRRGDVAVFDSPVDGTRLIKRVVATAGDEVRVHDGHLSINGRSLADASGRVERFDQRMAHLNLADGGGPDIDALVVPRGQVLVMGDHRGSSFDSRYFGLVDATSLYARATGVYYRRGKGLVWLRL